MVRRCSSRTIERSDSTAELTLPLPPEILSQLNEGATLRGVSSASLAARLLIAITRDGLMAAVLDER